MSRASIPEKTSKVLNIIVLGLALILIRVWYLSVVQHDDHLEKARKPQRRSFVETVERATIRDRFNTPLALNKMQYNAAVCYADIRQIPSLKWEKNAEGKRVRVRARAEYIKQLASLLAAELGMDAQKIEDTIHGKASLFPHTPFILKEDITENEYHRLKMHEMQWAGVRAERGCKRHYPLEKLGSDIIGYMGAINSNEYYQIAHEIKILQNYLNEREAGEAPMLPRGFQNPLEVRERLKALQEKAYTINDLIGKAGIEGAFDAELRGFAGKKTFEVDINGNRIRELPASRSALSGQRVLLTISSELQEFAEQLLADNESVREVKLPDGSFNWGTPWIKGGAIVAMDPHTGEILALASYPRFNPNDFIPSKSHAVPDHGGTSRWLENENYVSKIWNGILPMQRERFDSKQNSFYEESIPLNLSRYLQAILPPQHPIFSALHQLKTLKDVYHLLSDMDAILHATELQQVHLVVDALFCDGQHRPSRRAPPPEEALHMRKQCEDLQKKALSYLELIPANDDKILLLDLCKLFISTERFTPELLKDIGTLSLDEYYALTQSRTRIQHFIKNQIKETYRQLDFQIWREAHFKEYLKTKRQEEKNQKKYARPYTEYLDQMEKQMFETFWQENAQALIHCYILELPPNNTSLKPYFLFLQTLKNDHLKEDVHALKATLHGLSEVSQVAFLNTMRPFEELTAPLFGRYRSLRNTKGAQLEKHLAAAFYPLNGYGYGRSQAFRQSTPQGSIFKLIIAYQGLIEKLSQAKEEMRAFDQINPLTLIDNLKWHATPGSHRQILGHTLDGQPITRFYKGGKLPRSSHPNIGKVDIVSAIEQSSNIYFSILSGEHIEDPLNLIQASKAFGFGEKTGIELPGEIAGALPDDLSYNKTGLYSFSIGQHSLVVTPLQTAVMLAAIGNGGRVLKPKIVNVIAGQEPLYHDLNAFTQNKTGERLINAESLSLVGIHFPLFSAANSKNIENCVWYNTPEIKRTLFLPDAIRDPLVLGMQRTVSGAKGTARAGLIRSLYKKPEWKKNYLELQEHLIGKTGTAEIMYKQAIDFESKASIHNHIWFGGIVFEEEHPQTFQKPELVVVVYLRFSEAGGKEAAPLATEIAKKWRAIKEASLN